MGSIFEIEIKKAKDGQFYGVITCVNNGEDIFTTETRPSKHGLMDTLQNFVSFMHNNVCPIVDNTVA